MPLIWWRNCFFCPVICCKAWVWSALSSTVTPAWNGIAWVYPEVKVWRREIMLFLIITIYSWFTNLISSSDFSVDLQTPISYCLLGIFPYWHVQKTAWCFASLQKLMLQNSSFCKWQLHLSSFQAKNLEVVLDSTLSLKPYMFSCNKTCLFYLQIHTELDRFILPASLSLIQASLIPCLDDKDSPS